MKHRYQILLETETDVLEFVSIALKLGGKITVSDNTGMKVNARSVLGMMYALTFEELWCESEEDIYHAIDSFVV